MDNESSVPGEAMNTTTTGNLGEDSVYDSLKSVMDVMLITLTILLMLAFGCTIKVEHLKHHITHPMGITLGLLCQFILVPYAAFIMVHALGLDQWNSLSMIILSTCPAGGISNMMTYFAEGDVALSVIITATSTVAALGFMPLNLWLFTRNWIQNDIIIPYIQTIVSLATIMIPTCVGMAMLRKFPTAAKWTGKVCSVIGSLLILVTVGLSSYMYPQMYSSPWQVWIATGSLPLITFLIGYLLSMFIRLPHDIRRTVAMTTSAKSIALCLTLIVLSFSKSIYLQCLVFPELFSIFMIFELAAIAILYRLFKYFNAKYVLSHEGKVKYAEKSTLDGTDSMNMGTCTIMVKSNKNRNVNRRMTEPSLSLPSAIKLAAFQETMVEM